MIRLVCVRDDHDPRLPASTIRQLHALRAESPQRVARNLGADLVDPGFRTAGLSFVECQLQEVQAAAVASGRPA
jgi:hypothetical protein